MNNHRLGFIELAEGVRPRHVLCYLFAAFISIGLFTYASALTPYIFDVNLQVPKQDQGSVSGSLQTAQEIILIAVIGLWGALSDRIGRRPVYIVGFLVLGLGYAVYPFVTSVTELHGARLILGIGMAATSAMLATLAADYPVESSRGKLIGVSFVLNGVGSVLFFLVLTRLPEMFQGRGVEPLWAGRYSLLFVAGVAVLGAIVMLGLKGGRPAQTSERLPLLKLLSEGLGAARNPRIMLSYSSAFTARGDMVLIALFLSLWVVQTATAAGADAAEAAKVAGMVVGITQVAALLWAMFFGWLADRIDRATVCIIAFAIAALGYGWTGSLPDVTATSAIPALVIMGMGQASVILACTVLLGQEAPPERRGSVFGVQGLVGALGIMAISVFGGQAFDAIGPGSPFVIMALANIVLVVWSILVRARTQPRVAEPA